MFIIAILLVITAVIFIVVSMRLRRAAAATSAPRITATIVGAIGAGLAVLAAAALFASTFYTQDVGEAKVLKDWTGNIVGEDITPGADFKAPWVDVVDFDIRNQIAAYVGDGFDDYNGSVPNGPQITVQDREGVTANLDIVVIYSIDPDSVTEIYSEYLNQENFRARLIEQDIRSVVRNVPAKYNTLELLNGREAASNDIKLALEKRWESAGVIVESVSLQEIRYSEEVKGRFDAAQAARIEVEKAKAELEATEVSAQQKVVQAQAEADANAILNASLTPAILQQRYLDTLSDLAAAGNLVVVPEGFGGIVNVSGGTP
jgi:regulator of protease activity HflC (stomatin/prohibitin superfamily)